MSANWFRFALICAWTAIGGLILDWFQYPEWVGWIALIMAGLLAVGLVFRLSEGGR